MTPICGRISATRFLIAMLLLALSTVGGGSIAFAAPAVQEGTAISLANAGRGFIERRSDGGFVARPIFDPRPDLVAYGVRDPGDGSWLGAVWFIQDDGTQIGEGWEYTIEYPNMAGQQELDPGRAYILALFAGAAGGIQEFEATIPSNESTGLWDQVLKAFDPATWARSFAGWVVEGVHAVLCSVVERVTASDLNNCST